MNSDNVDVTDTAQLGDIGHINLGEYCTSLGQDGKGNMVIVKTAWAMWGTFSTLYPYKLLAWRMNTGNISYDYFYFPKVKSFLN